MKFNFNKCCIEIINDYYLNKNLIEFNFNKCCIEMKLQQDLI